MKIPEKIRIGSIDYRVIKLDKALIDCRNRLLHGQIDCSEFTITLAGIPVVDQQHLELTFLHEMFHGMLEDRSLNPDDEEELVEELSKSLHGIIRDNPGIFNHSPDEA